jgi:hypothetical protein
VKPAEFLDLFKVPLAVLLGLLLAGGAVYGVLALGGGSGSTPALMDTVPANASMVVTAEGAAVEAETSRQVVDSALNASGVREPGNYTELVALAGVGTGLDTDDLDRIVAYGTVAHGNDADAETRGYLGVLVESEWSESGFVAAVAGRSQASRESYSGFTVHVVGEGANATWVGVVEEGRYVVGTEAAVTDALDVVAGEQSAWDGDVRAALDRVDDGSVRFASAVPRSFLQENPTLNQQGLPVDFSAIKSTRVLAGSMRTERENVTMQLRVRTNTTANAETLTGQLDGFASIRASMASSQAVGSALRATTFEQDGETVVVSYEGPEAEFVPAFRRLVADPLGPLGA